MVPGYAGIETGGQPLQFTVKGLNVDRIPDPYRTAPRRLTQPIAAVGSGDVCRRPRSCHAQ